MDALRRDMEELRVRQQDDIDRLTQEKRTLADEKAQLSREVAALNDEGRAGHVSGRRWRSECGDSCSQVSLVVYGLGMAGTTDSKCLRY